MASRLIIATILFAGLIGSAQMQGQGLGQSQQMMQPMQNMQLPQGNLFSGLLGGQNGGQGGLTETLRQIPQRTMEMVNQLMSGVRNMLPGNLGRNGKCD